MARRRKPGDEIEQQPVPAGLLTIEQLCGIFRVTDKAIRNWAGAGMPVEIQGKQGRGSRTLFKLEDCVRWYFETNHERLELDRQRAALSAEQRETAALRNAEARRDLASISEIAKQFSDAVGVAQALLLAIPVKEAPALAPLTDANAIESRLRKAIHGALQQLAEYGSAAAIESRHRSSRRNGSVRSAADGDGE
ncbi:MAG TPA: hypothetical protein VD932_03595 [Aquabacterium sp.]|nr:hypothetical protein [Aquabacterium sp.]